MQAVAAEMNQPETAFLEPITEPEDSSMPPVMMTRAWPMAKIANRPTRLAVLARFTGDRNRLLK